MVLFLENSWSATPTPGGTWTLILTNLADETLRDFTLSLTSITRVEAAHRLDNAHLVRRNANYHEFAPLNGAPLAPGASWRFQVEGLNRAPLHRNDAAKSGYVSISDGRRIPVQIGDLMPGGKAPSRRPPARLPGGRLTLPFALLPWPNRIEVTPAPAPAILHAAEGTLTADRRLMLGVDALHARLFPTAPRVFQLSPTNGSRALAFANDAALPEEGYRLEFGAQITLSASSDAGRRHGLVSLAQILHGAFSDPELWFPASGVIEDTPRYGWRGCHLDVCRHFWTFEQVLRIVDILAWQKLNVFHWHLTDDEAWRAEILAYPNLTRAGATRAPHLPAMLPQLGDGIAPATGYYTQNQMRAVVAHAKALGIEVMPEIETPGHASAALAALPFLVDPDEPPESYRPVQGYPNNAWNPGVPESFTVLETILDEICAIFPSKHIHIGGDEVARNAWMTSPKARALMAREGLSGTFELQSWFLRRIRQMLRARGRVLVGWNEVAHGGGVPPEGTLLMAWETPEVGIDLARRGYDVVMTPGQAYYLDMVQGEDWLENGAGWAGPVSPEQSYTYEAEGDFPAELRRKMRGIQACIWCEHFTTPQWFNDLVFPRLCAVAEAGWTDRANKDWLRFARQVRLHPTL